MVVSNNQTVGILQIDKRDKRDRRYKRDKRDKRYKRDKHDKIIKQINSENTYSNQTPILRYKWNDRKVNVF